MLKIPATAKLGRKLPGIKLEPPQPLTLKVDHDVVEDTVRSLVGRLTPAEAAQASVLFDAGSAFGAPERVFDGDIRLGSRWLLPSHTSDSFLRSMVVCATAAGLKGSFLDFSLSLHRFVLYLGF